MISKVETYTKGPQKDKFTSDELKLFDYDGFTRNYMKITVKEVNDKYMDALCNIVKLQYNLPVKYLKLVPGTYNYISQKSYIQGSEKDIKNASVTIEPLNNDIVGLIQYTPINQSLPLGTIFTIDEHIDYETRDDGTEPERKFLWSSNLQTSNDIENKIKEVNPKSIHTKPYLQCCHYCSIDIGSHICGKFTVSEVNTNIIKSMALFGFIRDDESKTFTLWVFKCYNLLPIDIFKMMLEHKNIENDAKDFINEILSKAK